MCFYSPICVGLQEDHINVFDDAHSVSDLEDTQHVVKQVVVAFSTLTCCRKTIIASIGH